MQGATIASPMLIECDRCEATYDFPEDRIPSGGMRAKCAECGNVMQIGRAGSTPPAERPETLEPSMIKGPPAKSLPPIDAPPPRRDSAGPSVIVDMGQLGDPDEAAAAEQAAAQQAAFAPLATAPPVEAPASRHRVRDLPFGPEPSEIHEIKPPSIARYAVLAFVVALAGFATFVAAANDFEPIWYQDPVKAVNIAFGFEQPPAPPAPKKPKKVVEPVIGKLEIRDVEMTVLKQGRRHRLAVLRGRVFNDSNRVQHKIGLTADLVEVQGEDKHELTIATRHADCCEVLDDAAAKAAARQQDHPHFKPGSRPDLHISPDQSERFVIVLRDLDPSIDDKLVQPRVTVRFSEAENPEP